MLPKRGVNSTGFTLVELLIVIAIVAILVALALPSYQESVRKARRSDAQQELLEFAGTAERIFTQANSYATVTLPANTDFYTYSFPVVVTANSYTILATPTGSQADDKCGAMSLNQRGDKPNPGTLAGCWD